MVKEKDQESEEETQSEETDNEQGFVEIDGKKFVEDSENPGEAKKDDNGEFILFDEEQESEPKITLEDTHRLTKALQKGYTLTRQEIGQIRANLDKILAELTKRKEDDDEFADDEPLTTKKLLKILDSREKKADEVRQQSKDRIQQKINSQLDELKAQGFIQTQKEEDELLEYAVKIKETNLSKAYERLQEVKAARKQGIKQKIKKDVKIEAAKKIGTSNKTKVGEQGFDYGEIRGKSMQELAED